MTALLGKSRVLGVIALSVLTCALAFGISFAAASSDDGNGDPLDNIEYSYSGQVSAEEQCLREHGARSETVINVFDRATLKPVSVAVNVWCEELDAVTPPEGLPAKAGLAGDVVFENGHVKINYYNAVDPAQQIAPLTYLSDEEAQMRLDAAQTG